MRMCIYVYTCVCIYIYIYLYMLYSYYSLVMSTDRTDSRLRRPPPRPAASGAGPDIDK